MAGEQSRGFGVVAAEVRALAQRSATAAKEITQLISASVGKITEGAGVAEHAGKTMKEILGLAQSMSDQAQPLAEIAARFVLTSEGRAGSTGANVSPDTF